jgi:hypothetical protein
LSPLCIALSDSNGVLPLYLSNPEPGSSMHAIGKPENVKGTFEPAGLQHVVAIRGDKLVAEFGAHVPRHLKVDVDGHELQVLEGMGVLLDDVRTVWIEMISSVKTNGGNDRIRAILNARGLIEQPFAAGKMGRNKLFVRKSATS